MSTSAKGTMALNSMTCPNCNCKFTGSPYIHTTSKTHLLSALQHPEALSPRQAMHRNHSQSHLNSLPIMGPHFSYHDVLFQALLFR